METGVRGTLDGLPGPIDILIISPGQAGHLCMGDCLGNCPDRIKVPLR